MPFSRPLVIYSALSAPETRARIRRFATVRELLQLEAFRRRPVVGWRLSTVDEPSLFQPEYGDTLDVGGARFVALVEPMASGSRIRGRVFASRSKGAVTTVSMLLVASAALATLADGRAPAAKVLAIASLTMIGALLGLRYSLRSTARVVEARLRHCLETREPRAAA